MAWQTVGTSNDDMVDQLVALRVIKPASSAVVAAFRVTDRGDFVDTRRNQAYWDRPFKSDLVHLSAPHMYVTVLEHLDLRPGHAFLNIGSGTGYLSCLVSCLIGERGLSHGIEINEACYVHGKASCKRWFDNILKRRSEGEENLPPISKEGVSLMLGNCFDIDVPASSSSCKYDRIYIGAGCPEQHKEFFFSLLSDDGIIVVPINEAGKLLSIRRVCGSVYSITQVADVHFAPLQQIPPSSDVSSRDGTRPLVKLPPVLWAPTKSRHGQFPKTFRDASSLLILSNRFSCLKRTPEGIRCLCPILPSHVWMYVLSFCTRDWFVPILSPLLQANADLRAERSMRISAEAALLEANKARKKAEDEVTKLKVVVTQLKRTLQVQMALPSSAPAAVAPGPFAMFFAHLGQGHHDSSSSSSSDDDDEDEDLEEDEDADDEEDEDEDEEEEEMPGEIVPLIDTAMILQEANSPSALAEESLLDQDLSPDPLSLHCASEADVEAETERESFDTERESFESDDSSPSLLGLPRMATCTGSSRKSISSISGSGGGGGFNEDSLEMILEDADNLSSSDEDESKLIANLLAPVRITRVNSGVTGKPTAPLLITFPK